MNINKIALSLITLFLLFAIFSSISIGMSWDEPQRHWQGAIRADYLKSFAFGKFQWKSGAWSEIEPGFYDTFSFANGDKKFVLGYKKVERDLIVKFGNILK